MELVGPILRLVLGLFTAFAFLPYGRKIQKNGLFSWKKFIEVEIYFIIGVILVVDGVISLIAK